jgi:hypothetical protein
LEFDRSDINRYNNNTGFDRENHEISYNY